MVFPWEKSGWKLLYSIPARGGEPTLLTPGEHEVSSVALDAQRKTIIYSSNLDDVERWHLWKVDVDGGEPKQVTSGAGVEQAPSFLANGDVAYLEERADAASRIQLLVKDGEVRTLSSSAEGAAVFEQFKMPEIVSFSAPDGLRIYGHLYRPTGVLSVESHPAFVYAHGGCHAKSDPVFRSHIREGLFQYLVSRGYFVFAVNFSELVSRRAPDCVPFGNGRLRHARAVGGAPRKVYAPESARYTATVGWSADGAELAVLFNAPEGFFIDIFSLPSQERRRINLPRRCLEMSRSPDGGTIACGDRRSLYLFPSTGGEPITVTNRSSRDWSPSWSSDGRRLFFVSNRGGSMDL